MWLKWFETFEMSYGRNLKGRRNKIELACKGKYVPV